MFAYNIILLSQHSFIKPIMADKGGFKAPSAMAARKIIKLEKATLNLFDNQNAAIGNTTGPIKFNHGMLSSASSVVSRLSALNSATGSPN